MFLIAQLPVGFFRCFSSWYALAFSSEFDLPFLKMSFDGALGFKAQHLLLVRSNDGRTAGG